MERLHKIGFVCVVCSFAFGPCTVWARDVCSLTVKVLSPSGQRVAAPIAVEEKNGRVQEKDQEGNDVQFCDLGILPVTVTVGSDGLCNQITVHSVPVTWRQPYLLVVTYDPDACVREELAPSPNANCEILLRVADSGGKWVPDATVNLFTPTRYVLKTDRYGRVDFGAGVNNLVHGTVTAVGFRSADFTASCSGSQDRREKDLCLEKP